MKLNFKLVWFLTFILFAQTPAFSRDVFLITFNSYKDKAKTIRNILVKNFVVPMNLINIRKTQKPCLKIKGAIIHICINENNEMNFPFINREVLEISLKYFWEKK
jgi:hypothetical protein